MAVAVMLFVLVLSALAILWVLGPFLGWSQMLIVGIWILIVCLVTACLATMWKRKKLAVVFWVLVLVEALWILYDFRVLRP